MGSSFLFPFSTISYFRFVFRDFKIMFCAQFCPFHFTVSVFDIVLTKKNNELKEIAMWRCYIEIAKGTISDVSQDVCCFRMSESVYVTSRWNWYNLTEICFSYITYWHNMFGFVSLYYWQWLHSCDLGCWLLQWLAWLLRRRFFFWSKQEKNPTFIYEIHEKTYSYSLQL